MQKNKSKFINKLSGGFILNLQERRTVRKIVEKSKENNPSKNENCVCGGVIDFKENHIFVKGSEQTAEKTHRCSDCSILWKKDGHPMMTNHDDENSVAIVSGDSFCWFNLSRLSCS